MYLLHNDLPIFAIMSTESPVQSENYAFDSKGPISKTDIENGSGEVNHSTFVVDRAVEKKLLWKFDLYILPMLAVMYLFK